MKECQIIKIKIISRHLQVKKSVKKFIHNLKLRNLIKQSLKIVIYRFKD
jgi:hypothetical protein